MEQVSQGIFAAIESDEYTNRDCNDAGALNVGRSRPVGVKYYIAIAKNNREENRLSKLASEMLDKNAVEKKELELRCITTLPEGDMNTNLLMKFLASTKENDSASMDDEVESFPEDENSRCLFIVDIIDKNP